jgi:hypothetical protein
MTNSADKRFEEIDRYAGRMATAAIDSRAAGGCWSLPEAVHAAGLSNPVSSADLTETLGRLALWGIRHNLNGSDLERRCLEEFEANAKLGRAEVEKR